MLLIGGVTQTKYHHLRPLSLYLRRSLSSLAVVPFFLLLGGTHHNSLRITNSAVLAFHPPVLPNNRSSSLISSSREQPNRFISMSSEKESTITSTETETNDVKRETKPIPHLCFLIHGWLGTDEEMSYIEEAIQTKSPNKQIILHKTKCNIENTNDGIAMGGKRLADEVKNFIASFLGYTSEEEKKEQPNEEIVTLSFVGNSLGGLYARYAIAELFKTSQRDNSTISFPLKNTNTRIKIHFNVFCTTATPHLGIASHTYIPIPRIAERMIGNFMGVTVRDLFRTDDDLVRRMALEAEFLDPLSLFQKRIVYANAFWTDFQVPTRTAAFLNSDSRYPHVWVPPDDDGQEWKKDALVATFHTEKRYPEVDLKTEGRSENDLLFKMSTSLDSLGWKKVFIDVRNFSPVPSVKVPYMKESRVAFDETLSQKRLENGIVTFESREVASLLSPTEKVSIPLGHTVMVANSKSEFYKEMNKGGRPIMNHLAEELVREIRLWGEVDKKECDNF